MKNFVSATLALSLFTLGLTACRKHRVDFIETSYLVVQPAAHTGEFVRFPVPQTPKAVKPTPYYVHFNKGGSPCADETIQSQADQPFECKVTATPKTAARYYFYIDSTSGPAVKGRCPTWCSGMIVVGPSQPIEEPSSFLPPTSVGPGATEVLIYDTGSGPMADLANVPSGGRVRWVMNAPDKGWTVVFNKPICDGKTTATEAADKVAYCNLTNADPGPYDYQITVDGTAGPINQQLNIVPSAYSSATPIP